MNAVTQRFNTFRLTKITGERGRAARSAMHERRAVRSRHDHDGAERARSSKSPTMQLGRGSMGSMVLRRVRTAEELGSSRMRPALAAAYRCGPTRRAAIAAQRVLGVRMSGSRIAPPSFFRRTSGDSRGASYCRGCSATRFVRIGLRACRPLSTLCCLASHGFTDVSVR
jgi:hypothetical protein